MCIRRQSPLQTLPQLQGTGTWACSSLAKLHFSAPQGDSPFSSSTHAPYRMIPPCSFDEVTFFYFRSQKSALKSTSNAQELTPESYLYVFHWKLVLVTSSRAESSPRASTQLFDLYVKKCASLQNPEMIYVGSDQLKESRIPILNMIHCAENCNLSLRKADCPISPHLHTRSTAYSFDSWCHINGRLK